MRTTKNSYKFSFKLYRQLADESYAISLVLRYNRKRFVYTLPFTVYPEQWDDIRERYIDENIVKEIIRERDLKDADRRKTLRSLHKDALVNNIYIDRKAIELRDIIDDYEKRKVPFTNEMIIERLFTRAISSNVENYLLTHIERLKSEKAYGTADTFSDLHICLLKYDKKFNTRYFPEIDYNYVKGYFNYYVDAGRTIGGISVNLRALRTLLNTSIKDNIGCPETYPFSNQYGTRTGKDIFSVTKETEVTTRKRYIPIDYLQQFYKKEFTRIPLQRSKALFFFSFFCGGINFKDMAELRKSDIKHGFDQEGNPIRYFIYRRAKVKKDVEIQINDDIQKQIDILQDPMFGKAIDNYLLPIYVKAGLDEKAMHQYRKDKLKRMNNDLRDIAKELNFPEGLEDLSSYFARHSFAMRLFKKTMSIDVVSAGLRHSNIETTKIYLESFGKDEIAKVTEGLLD